MPRPALIDRAAVLRASLDVADEGGLGALTMHQVAARLGVSTMALYRHVANKADLLDGVVEGLLGEIVVPAVDVSWAERLALIAEETRSIGHRHPTVFPLLLQRSPATPDARSIVDAICGCLADAGVPDGEIARTERLLSTLVLGFVISEVAGRFTLTRTELDADFARLLELGRRVVGLVADPSQSG